MFLTYHRFFKNGETGSVLQPIDVMTEENPFRTRTEDEMRREEGQAEAVSLIYRKPAGQVIQADFEQLRKEAK